MKRLIYNALSIESGEGLTVLLLIIQSFFIGVFSQSFEISATALFMETYGKSMIGSAYLASGIVGIVLTAIYSKLQGNISFTALSITNLLFITLTTAAMWYGFNVSSDERLIFVAFLLMGPLFILSLVGFSGMVGRLFTLRQGKRLFSIVDSGLIFGILIISFFIPFLLPILPETKDLILISAVSIFMSLIVQIIISIKFNLNSESEDSETTEVSKKSAGVRVFFTNKYVRLTSLFVMLTMVAAFFVTYSFLAVTKINYPETKDFAAFLGKFMFAVMAFSFIIKTFIYSKLMKTYGLKVNLMILPVLLLFFVAVTASAGTFFGYEEGSASFLIFFLLTALVRFFAINLKDSIQTPSLKLLFQPIDKDVRYDIQAKVEGVINEISAVIAGGILASLALVSFFESIHYTYSLVIIVALWVYVTVQLYREYQNTLRASLANYKKEEQSSDTADEAQTIETDGNTSKVIYSMEMTRVVDPTTFNNSVTELFKTGSEQLQTYALKNIDQQNMISAHNEVKEVAKSSSNNAIKKLASTVEQNLNDLIKLKSTVEEVSNLARSKEKTDRQKAAKIIAAGENAAFLPLLKRLLKDIDPLVKIASINAASKGIYKELWPVLIDYLDSPYYASSAKAALINLGEEAMPLLEKSFLKSGISGETMVLITSIIGNIPGEKSLNFLLDKISFPDRNVVLEALNSLSNRDYEADDKSINKLIQATELNIGIAAWNLSIINDLKQAGYDNELTSAMQIELDKSFNLVFTILSVAYDKSSIQHIRENIESGTTEAISFAIEMLDLFVSEQLKSTLFPLLEDNKLEDKIRELELHFPIYHHDKLEVLYQIMNRSSNYISHYTKATAIYTLLENEESEVRDDLVANLFNPDPVLRETAAVVMNQIDARHFEQCIERLEDEVKAEVVRAADQFSKDKTKLKIEKAYLLNNHTPFKNLNPRSIMDLALNMKDVTKSANEDMIVNGVQYGAQSIFIILDGEAILTKNGNEIDRFSTYDVIGDMLVQEHSSDSKITAKSTCRCYEIEDKSIQELMFKEPDIITVLASLIDKKNEKVATSVN